MLLAGSGVNGTGNDGDNGIAGNELSNLLNGGGGADTLKGAGGDDFLDGGTGADLMLGGEGGDIFIVDDAGDVVTEHADEGFDMVQTGVSYSLAAGSEVEVLYADPATTTAAINLTGNEFDNFLTTARASTSSSAASGSISCEATAAATRSCGRPSPRLA